MHSKKQVIERYTSLLNELIKNVKNKEGKLRFNRPVALASDLAQQYFCEKKVEIQYQIGKIETETKRFGTEAHQIMLEGSEKIRREKLWEKIFSEKPVLTLETRILARYNNVILAGRPDCILFANGQPMVIFEYKFSKSRRPYRDHHVQTRVYGVILNKMGFNTEHLIYAITMINPRVKNKAVLRRKIIDKVVTNKSKDDVLKLEEATIYLNKFYLKEAENDLDWALEFWTGGRDAIPTRNPNKCFSCEYLQSCEAAVKRTNHG